MKPASHEPVLSGVPTWIPDELLRDVVGRYMSAAPEASPCSMLKTASARSKANLYDAVNRPSSSSRVGLQGTGSVHRTLEASGCLFQYRGFSERLIAAILAQYLGATTARKTKPMVSQ